MLVAEMCAGWKKTDLVFGKCGTGKPSVLLIKVGVEGLSLLNP